MPRVIVDFTHYYYEEWGSLAFQAGKNDLSYVRNYITKSIDTNPQIEGQSYVETTLTIYAINIREITGRSYFAKDSWVWISFPDGVGEIPDYVLLNAVGTLDFYRSEHIGFWKSLGLLAKGTLSGPGFKIWLAVVAPSLFAAGGSLEFIGKAYDWIVTVATKITDSWLKRVNGYIDWVENFSETYIQRIQGPLDTLKTKFYTVTSPAVEQYREIITLYGDTTAKIKDTTQRVIDTIERPVLMLDREIFLPLRLAGRNLEQQISDVANFLAVFGINEGKKVEIRAESLFDALDWKLNTWINDLNTRITQIDTTFKNFRNLVFKPVDDIVKRINPMVQAVIDLTEKQAAKDAKLKKTALQNTLEAYPATSAIAIDEGQPDYDLVGFIQAPFEEGTLPEIKLWFDEIVKADRNLYVDDDGKPISLPIGKNNTLTSVLSELRGHSIAVSDALATPEKDPLADLESRIRLYELGLNTAQAVNFILPVDKPEQIMHFTINTLYKITFFSGWLVLKGFDFLFPENMKFEISTPGETMEDLIKLNEELINHYREADRRNLELVGQNPDTWFGPAVEIY